jgi:hypothetical protein
VEGRAIHCVYSLITNLYQPLNHGFDIFKHKFRRNARSGDALTSEKQRSRRVLGYNNSAVMRPAVHFDCQPCVGAEKIKHVNPRRVLAAEFVAAGAGAQCLLEGNFRRGHLLAELAGEFDSAGLASDHARPSTMLRMVPLP